MGVDTVLEEVLFEGEVEVDAVAIGDQYFCFGLHGESVDINRIYKLYH